MGYSGGKGVAIIFVLLLMIGTAGIFVIGTALNELNPDPYNVNHEYSYTGTLYGEDCTGKGSTTFADENANYHTYMVKIKLTNASGKTDEIKSGVIFNLDETMIPELF